MSPRLVLVGPPGAGKTTVGNLVAVKLGLPFRDTDADVERVAGKPISDIFVEDGEPAFRELERSAVVAALAEHTGVLALGGGAVTTERIRDLLRGHRVIFLDVNLAAAADRVGLNQERPLLLGNPRTQLRKLLEARRPLYEQVATVTVDTTRRSAEDVAAEVVLHAG